MTYNGELPSWRSYFNDDEISVVMRYRLETWGNKATPVLKETVAEVKAELSANSNAWTAESLGAFARGK